MNSNNMTEVITDHQAGAIINLIDQIATIRLERSHRKSKIKLFMEILYNFCVQYHINSPKELAMSKYEEALGALQTGLEKLLSHNIHKEELTSAQLLLERGRKELKLNEAKLLNLAYHKLPLTSRIYSLEKLSTNQLASLESMLFPEEA